jgi:hypothetical protein
MVRRQEVPRGVLPPRFRHASWVPWVGAPSLRMEGCAWGRAVALCEGV